MIDNQTNLQAVIDQTLQADLTPIRNFLFTNPSQPLVAVYDYRNFCHGRFIFISNHLEDSAIVMMVTPRERDIVRRTREFLPPTAKLVIIETEHDAPEASFDLLIRTTEFYGGLCQATGANPESPKNPGHIDKRKPIWVPFMAELKKQGPLDLS